MKKVILILITFAVAAFVGCAQAPASVAPVSDVPAEDASKAPSGDSIIPDGVTGGKKIAVVRNLAEGDHTQQFLDGAVSEGKALGFTVDTFVTDGDDAKLQETVAQVIQKDYDGLIVSNGQLSYSYDMLKPAIEKGMVVATFDTMPFKDGDATKELLAGVTSTSQDDQILATLSLTDLVETTGKKSAKILKLWMGPGVPPLDRRNEVYQQMEKDGLIETLELIAPSDTANVRGDMTNKTSAILLKYPEGTVDGIWGSYDELARGTLQALIDAGRTDIPMFTIDISNDDMNLMIKNSDVWKSTAAVDPKLIGIADMRLIAIKLAGEETPDYYTLDAQLVKTPQLNADTTMENLGTVVDGWGTVDSISDLNRPWMDALRTQNSAA